MGWVALLSLFSLFLGCDRGRPLPTFRGVGGDANATVRPVAVSDGGNRPDAITVKTLGDAAGREAASSLPLLGAPRNDGGEGARVDADVPTCEDAGRSANAAKAPRAPSRYDHVVPRLSWPPGRPFENLRYEGNNIVFRGRRLPSGRFEATGEIIAQRWRDAASRVLRVFVLRDALFSQQDHPLDHDAQAISMPPNWVTAAVDDVVAGRTPRSPTAPAIDDDEAWASLGSPDEVFGSFPPSERLLSWAKRRRGSNTVARARIETARKNIRSLAADAQAMAALASAGAEAVALSGAERISASDRAYFGDELRRQRVIIITVENPNLHEIEDEGKGFLIAGRSLVATSRRIATRAVLRRRLADGDLALERYDLTNRSEWRRASELLEWLIPETGPESSDTAGGQVWLWVNGRLDERGVTGEDASELIRPFREFLEQRNIDMSRLGFLSKPHVVLPRANRARAFCDAADEMRRLGLPISVNLGTRALGSLFLRVAEIED